MKTNLIAPNYSVAGQITEPDLATLAAEGFKTVICNRPDSEVEPELHSRFIEAEARRLGLDFVYNPVSPQGLTMENIERQARAIEESTGPVFAYCRSGRRSTLCWSFVQAGRMEPTEIINAAAGAGYQIESILPQIEAFAAQLQAV